MKLNRVFLALAAFIFLTGFTGFTGFVGFGFGTGGAKRFVDLKDLTDGGASGEATIEPFESMMPELRTLGIIVYGLKPASVYSLWYEDESGKREMAGVDTSHFRTDGAGKARYITTVYEYEIDDWRYLVVMHHPDGDPKNTAGMTPVLRGDMVYGAHS